MKKLLEKILFIFLLLPVGILAKSSANPNLSDLSQEIEHLRYLNSIGTKALFCCGAAALIGRLFLCPQGAPQMDMATAMQFWHMSNVGAVNGMFNYANALRIAANALKTAKFNEIRRLANIG